MVVRAIIGAIAALGIGGGAGYWVAPGPGEDPEVDAVEVVFFDAGQADCALILTPAVDGHEEGVIVIDGVIKGWAESDVVPFLGGP